MISLPHSLKTSNRRGVIFAKAPGLESMESLLDNISDVLFCVKDRQRAYVAANQAFVHRMGLRRREELLGRTAREIFPEVLAASYEKDDDEVFHSGAPVRDRLEMITGSDGSMGWFVSHKVAVRSNSGDIIAVSGLSRDLGTPANPGTELGEIAKSLETIHKDYALPLRVEELAKRAGLSWSQYQRRIRSITGLTPRQLLSKSRIEAAAHALQDSSHSLSDVAIDCGFYDQAAFCRQFRAMTGLTPGQYRDAMARERSERTGEEIPPPGNPPGWSKGLSKV